MLYVTALLVTSLVSVCTGTSWGSAGTIGVAFMGVAVGITMVNIGKRDSSNVGVLGLFIVCVFIVIYSKLA